MHGVAVQFLSQEDLLEKGMATQLQYSCLENSMDRGAWWVTEHRVAKSRTRLSNFSHSLMDSSHMHILLVTMKNGPHLLWEGGGLAKLANA